MQYALEWLKCQPILMGMLDSSKLYAAASASSGYPHQSLLLTHTWLHWLIIVQEKDVYIYSQHRYIMKDGPLFQPK